MTENIVMDNGGAMDGVVVWMASSVRLWTPETAKAVGGVCSTPHACSEQEWTGRLAARCLGGLR
jgi:hypothetical protein